jgi:hypothetical protein
VPSHLAAFAVNDLVDDIEQAEDFSYSITLFAGDGTAYQLRLAEPYWVNAALFSKALLVDMRTRRTTLSTKVDLLDLGARERLLRNLAVFEGEASWSKDIHSLFARVALHVGQAEAPVVLSSVAPREDERFLEVAGFPLLIEDPTILFADGGARKSLLALYWAAQLSATVPTLYLDWEMRGEDHQERLASLFGDQPFPDLYYLSARAPLPVIEDSLRGYIDQRGIEFLVIDSAAPAAATEGPEIPTEFFGALRRLKCGALILAHMNRLKDTEKPFGSAFWHNYARSSWYLEAQEGNRLELTNRKNSFGRLLSLDPKGVLQLRYRVFREGDATEIVLDGKRTFVVETKVAPDVQEDEP